MLFKINHSVPANTTALNPDWQKLKIAQGTIVEWMVHMPEECADLMQFRVERNKAHIFPFTGSVWMYGMFEPTVIKDNLPIDAAPYVLDIYAFNLDDSYSHEYNIHVNIEPAKPVTVPEEGVEGIWERLKGIVGVD